MPSAGTGASRAPPSASVHESAAACSAGGGAPLVPGEGGRKERGRERKEGRERDSEGGLSLKQVHISTCYNNLSSPETQSWQQSPVSVALSSKSSEL